ncbi:MAG: LysM domain-containing protein, partial [Rickettsiales bacterium]|nr:LysM domain-containing protein [Rickettsiales bacterium]
MQKYYILFLGLVIVGCTQKSVEVVNKGGEVFRPNYSETYVESPDGKMARSLRGRNDSDKAQEISIINRQSDNGSNIYVVQAGDNLSSIATKTNMTTVEIAQLNNLEKPYPIRIGQKLKVSGMDNNANQVVEDKSAVST